MVSLEENRGADEVTLSVAERMEAIAEIQRLFAGRLRVMDTKQWDRYGGFHTEDVVSVTFDPDHPVVGRAALTERIRKVLDGNAFVTSVHHGHTPEIVLTSDATATGIWAMEDKLWWTNGEVEEHLHGYGHYYEEYRKVEGVWLISYRKLTRLRVDHTPEFFSYHSAA